MDFYDVETVGNTALEHIKPDETYCPIRFQGQWQDQETGLNYNRFRYYEPGLGYISSDPVGLSGGYRDFQYVTSPSAWSDPLGLWTFPSEFWMPTKRGYQRHHIIPNELFGCGKAPMHPVLRRLGNLYNQDGAVNLMYLPVCQEVASADGNTKSSHLGPHDAYTRSVERDLEGLLH